jgi:hypothetical protein
LGIHEGLKACVPPGGHIGHIQKPIVESGLQYECQLFRRGSGMPGKCSHPDFQACMNLVRRIVKSLCHVIDKSGRKGQNALKLLHTITNTKEFFMLSQLKKYFWIALGLAVLYCLLAYHYVFFSLTSFEMLKKNELNFRYTFYNVVDKSPEKIMKIDSLREAGIGELLVERGVVSDEKLDKILRQIEME